MLHKVLIINQYESTRLYVEAHQTGSLTRDIRGE